MGKIVRILLKAPNQKIVDQTVECDPSWKILELKQKISSVYPSKPTVGEQKLIYAGHLLRNEQVIADILQTTDEHELYTFHLVCYMRKTTEAANVESVQANGSQGGSSSSSFNPQVTSVPNVSVMPPMMTNPEQIIQQMALMQQMYSQYMQNFMTLNAGNTNVTYPGTNFGSMHQTQPLTNVVADQANVLRQRLPTVPQTVPPAPAIPAEAQEQRPAVPPQPPRPVQQQPINAMPAAGAGVRAVADDHDDHDWLDWFYWMSRAIVMLSLVYFYSNLSRLLTVIGVAFALYLYRTGIFFQQPQPQARVPIRNNQQEQGDEDGQPQAEAEDMSRNVEQTNVQTQASEPTGLRLVWLLVSSLFTSLVPEAPAPVNFN